MKQNILIHFWRPDPFGSSIKWQEKGILINKEKDYFIIKWISNNKWANNKILHVNKNLIINNQIILNI
jgi:hypothetical protein